MKMSKILSLVLALVMVLSCFAGCGLFGEKHTHNFVEGKCECGETDPNYKPEEKPDEEPELSEEEIIAAIVAEYAGTYDIKMWVSEIKGVDEQFQAQLRKFEAKYPGIIINAEIEGVTEADAATKVVADVVSAPDIFCFAQDQLARLVQAAALAQPVELVEKNLGKAHDAGSIAAASVAGALYAYPLTADNGFYMFYDSTLISEEDAESMEKLIEICNANGKTFRYPLSNGWYNAGFFFATGCSSTWNTDTNGQFTSIDDTYNSPEGLIAMKGMQKLAQADCFNADNEQALTDAAVVITGTWAVNDMKELFGEGYAATDLPSFTVDGKSYHIGSFTGNKLMGVKPQSDTKRTVVLSLLAEFLTSAECQLERFETFGWGPSNLEAQQSEAVQSDPALAAFAKQAAYGRPQGQIDGGWWDVAAILGDQAKAATSDADLQGALNAYDSAIEAILNKTDDEKLAWSVIGDMQNTGWKTDFPMTQESEGVWVSEGIEFVKGQGFKLRRGAAWDVQVGADGQMKTPEIEPANIIAEVTGTYCVRLEWDGTSTTATVTLIPA